MEISLRTVGHLTYFLSKILHACLSNVNVKKNIYKGFRNISLWCIKKSAGICKSYRQTIIYYIKVQKIPLGKKHPRGLIFDLYQFI